MTTTVTVKTHSWPAEVRMFPLDADRAPLADGEWSEPIPVEPNAAVTFHIHSGVDLMVHELPTDPA